MYLFYQVSKYWCTIFGFDRVSAVVVCARISGSAAYQSFTSTTHNKLNFAVNVFFRQPFRAAFDSPEKRSVRKQSPGGKCRTESLRCLVWQSKSISWRNRHRQSKQTIVADCRSAKPLDGSRERACIRHCWSTKRISKSDSFRIAFIWKY